MKAILAGITAILIAVGAYSAIFIVGETDFGVLKDARDGEVITILNPGFNIVWKAAIPWLVEVDYHRVKSSALVDAEIPLPGLEVLSSPVYSVTLRLNLVYEIDYHSISDELVESKTAYRNAMTKYITSALKKEIYTYLYPVYNNVNLEKDFEEMTASAFIMAKKACLAAGIKIITYDLIGSVGIPDDGIYREGTILAADLRKIENDNKKELILLENILRKEDQKHKKYLENLRDVAKLVKNNPDLLKYLYIKGFSDKVKVILTPDKTGLPFGLDLEAKEGTASKKGEIDNLR